MILQCAYRWHTAPHLEAFMRPDRWMDGTSMRASLLLARWGDIRHTFSSFSSVSPVSTVNMLLTKTSRRKVRWWQKNMERFPTSQSESYTNLVVCSKWLGLWVLINWYVYKWLFNRFYGLIMPMKSDFIPEFLPVLRPLSAGSKVGLYFVWSHTDYGPKSRNEATQKENKA